MGADVIGAVDERSRAGGEYFGNSVWVSGNTVVVGTPLDDTGGSQSGQAYLFDATDAHLIATLAKPTRADGDHFGNSVSVSGNTVVVGAPYGKQGGHAYVFDATTGDL